MSDPRPASGSSDINLLFGVLAVQMDFVDRDELIAAMNAWAVEKNRSLGAILCERGSLSPVRRELLEAVVREHLLQHGGDAAQSLAAVAAANPSALGLEVIPDADLRHSLNQLTKTADGSSSFVVSPTIRDKTRYRPLRSHARGGLGEVFVAEDVELHREVALKEIQVERADDPSSRARFVLEAEITGGLEHPGIVPVYGLGSYANGRPFYAMRFIRGDTLQSAIDRYHEAKSESADKRFAFRELLGRFLDVCNAIAYAHSRGVIHRDLKPSNVMLGRYGETLVVDWGLAKAGIDKLSNSPPPDAPTSDPVLKPVSGSAIEGITLPGRVIGTPSFMSPEQAAGEGSAVGTASDIYSLGAILYVILTGRKPFEGREALEVVEKVKIGIFPNPRSLNRETPPPLEAICLKAMAKIPEGRFATATDLATEVKHWLADEPTKVYRDPWAVRLGRWSRRHRVLVSSLGVFLVCVVVGLSVGAGLIWQEQKKTAEQKRIAEENFSLASQLGSRSLELLRNSESLFASSPRMDESRVALLVDATVSFRQQLANNPEDLALRRQATAQFHLTGNALRHRGRLIEAERLFGDAMRLSLNDRENGGDSSLTMAILRDAARVQSDAGRHAAASDLLRQSVEIAQGELATRSSDTALRRGLATSLLNFASLNHVRGQAKEARSQAQQCVALCRELNQLPTNAKHPYDPLFLAASLDLLASLERDAAQLVLAKPLHAEAIDLLKKLAEKSPDGINPNDITHFMALCQFENCFTRRDARQPTLEIEKTVGLVITQWERFVQGFPKTYMYRESLGRAYRFRGEIRAKEKRWDESAADLAKAKEIFEEAGRLFPQVVRFGGELGRTQIALAELATQRGDTRQANDWYRQAKQTLVKTISQSPDSTVDAIALRRLKELIPVPSDP